MRTPLGKKDKAVLRAFAEKRALDGYKLGTDGRRLDGYWLGGSVLNDLGSRSAQQVHRALRKEIAPFWLAEHHAKKRRR